MYGFSVYQLDHRNLHIEEKDLCAEKHTFQDNQWFLKQGWERSFQRNRVRYDTFRIEPVKLPVTPEYFRTEQEIAIGDDFCRAQELC